MVLTVNYFRSISSNVICCDSHFPQWTADGENLASGVSARLHVEEENRSENDTVTIPSLKVMGKSVKETNKRPENATPISVNVSNGRFLTLSFYYQCWGRGGFRKFTVYKVPSAITTATPRKLRLKNVHAFGGRVFHVAYCFLPSKKARRISFSAKIEMEPLMS